MQPSRPKSSEGGTRDWDRLLQALKSSTSRASQGAVDAIGQTLFDKQRDFEADSARRKAAFCTRRAGKTDLVPKKLLRRALRRPESISVYLAVTRVRAQELIWRPLEILNEVHALGGVFNGTKATLTLPNHAVLRLRGADDKRESEKGRGDKLEALDIDEAQMFPSDILTNMVEDVYGPSLEDVGGQISVYGTPGIVCAGKWFDMTRPDAENREKGWSVHSWSVLDNPFMAHMKARLPELKAEREWADDNPTYLREWLGKWVHDNQALFYRFDPLRNLHDIPESALLGGEWMHALGWDIGLRDEMALVAWAFHPHRKEVFEAFSWKQNGITSEAVMKEVKKLETRGYNFVKKVADTGGLGALVVEEVRQRFGIHFDAAKKTDKGAHVELFNDELLTGRAKLKRNSPYSNEIAVLPKDADAPEDKWPKEDPRFANHCADAGLYGWRAALHFLYRPQEEEAPKPGTPEWQAKHVKAAEEALQAQFEKESEELIRRKREEEDWEAFS